MNHHQANELLRSIGTKMSNLMFNLAQAKDSPDAKLFDELRREWDAAMAAYRRAPAPTSEPGARDAEFSQQEIANWQKAALDEVLSREGQRKYRHREPVTLDPSDLRDLMDIAVGRAFAARDLATPASPAVPVEDDLDALIYPPKAMLKREDWNPVTRKPYPADPAPQVAQASPGLDAEARERAVLAIEREIDNQLLASGMSPRDMYRQDGEYVLDAAIAAIASPLVEEVQRIVAGKVEALICPKCGIDRLKEGCASVDCAMAGTAQGAAE